MVVAALSACLVLFIPALQSYLYIRFCLLSPVHSRIAELSVYTFLLA